MPSKVYERPSAEQRFWKNVNKNTESDCWEWSGWIKPNGYGCFTVNRKNIYAHRLSYELHKGPIPEGMLVMHSCDNRKCIRPDHLSIGTHTENMYDMKIKNRQAKGLSNGNSKLNEFQVKEIKNKLNLGMKQVEIAKEYKVAKNQISKIKTGKNWSYVNV